MFRDLWIRYQARREIHRWFGFGPMYPFYREALRRLEEADRDATVFVPLEVILRDYGFTDEDLK